MEVVDVLQHREKGESQPQPRAGPRIGEHRRARRQQSGGQQDRIQLACQREGGQATRVGASGAQLVQFGRPVGRALDQEDREEREAGEIGPGRGESDHAEPDERLQGDVGHLENGQGPQAAYVGAHPGWAGVPARIL